jgi:hypothetical protein
MTVSLERPVLPTAARSMVEQHSLVDPYDEPHSVLGIRVVVSRDHLAAAVDMGGSRYYNGDRHPDTWTVDEIRWFAEFNVIHMDALELQRGAEAMAQMAEPDFYDQETHALVLGIYRAVDRAYPKAAGA